MVILWLGEEAAAPRLAHQGRILRLKYSPR
jgi:hypothetical protein